MQIVTHLKYIIVGRLGIYSPLHILSLERFTHSKRFQFSCLKGATLRFANLKFMLCQCYNEIHVHYQQSKYLLIQRRHFCTCRPSLPQLPVPTAYLGHVNATGTKIRITATYVNVPKDSAEPIVTKWHRLSMVSSLML